MYKEIPVFPLVTCGDVDSPVDSKAKWKVIVSIPARKLVTPTPSNSKAKLFGVGGWLVIVWGKKEPCSEAAALALYETSKGNVLEGVQKLGTARIRALRRSESISLIEVSLPAGQTKKCRYSGAVVDGPTAIQIWLRLSEPEDQESPTIDATTTSGFPPR